MEVERRLRNHPNIASVRTRSEWHQRDGEIIEGDICLKPGQGLTEKAFFDWRQHHISPYKIPRSIKIQ